MTFIELCLIEEQYSFTRKQATAAIYELADVDVEDDVVFQASDYIDDGLNTFDGFYAALAGDAISSDQAFNDISIERVPLEGDLE